MGFRLMVAVTMVAATSIPAAAQAARPVQVASDVFVERFIPGENGSMTRVLERSNRLQPGDRLVFVVNWKADGNRAFTVTNPVPRTVAFQRTAEGSEEVSIDGGKTWGKLADMRVRDADGSIRHATPDDVTDLRWVVPTRLAALGSGMMTYSGVVR